MNHPFTDVRDALRGWLTQYGWINFLLPYHLYILFGSVGYMLFYELITDLMNRSVHFLYLLSSISYWAFILALLLTLISSNVKYLPYALAGYVIQYLYPFNYFYFSTILRAAIFTALAILVLRYSAKVRE